MNDPLKKKNFLSYIVWFPCHCRLNHVLKTTRTHHSEKRILDEKRKGCPAHPSSSGQKLISDSYDDDDDKRAGRVWFGKG